MASGICGWVYMNLAYRTDRDEATREQLDGLPNVCRVEAVRDITGGVGCIQSHIKALQVGIDRKWETFAVLEDDMVWKEDTCRERLDRAIDFGINKGFHAYLLGTNPKHEFKAEETDKEDYVRVKYAIDAGATVFTRAGAIEIQKTLQSALQKSKDLLRKKGLGYGTLRKLTALAADRVRCDRFKDLYVFTDSAGRQPMHQPGGYSDLELSVQDHVKRRAD